MQWAALQRPHRPDCSQVAGCGGSRLLAQRACGAAASALPQDVRAVVVESHYRGGRSGIQRHSAAPTSDTGAFSTAFTSKPECALALQELMRMHILLCLRLLPLLLQLCVVDFENANAAATFAAKMWAALAPPAADAVAGNAADGRPLPSLVPIERTLPSSDIEAQRSPGWAILPTLDRRCQQTALVYAPPNAQLVAATFYYKWRRPQPET